MRTWIYEALKAVIFDKQYSNLYLKNHLQELPSKDQALATHIFYGTIQNYGFCQYVWKQYAQRKCPKRIEIILDMSVYQLFFLDKVPSYAIVNEAVVLAKKIDEKNAGFVNAILHKVMDKKVSYPKDSIEALSIQTSVPSWLLKMWKAQYGLEKAESMAKSTLSILPIYIRRNPLKISESDLLEYPEITKKENSDLYIYSGTSMNQFEPYKKGYVSVQEEGSYQISKWMDVQKGDTILDCCSAPGTKAFSMAEQMGDTGHIDCLDIHEHRVQLIRQDAKRLGIQSCHALCMDATNLKDLGMYDRVLCDVPCSGYGIMARKPDIKLHLNPSDMDTLIPLQKQILQEASIHVKENGILVYSTCTINKKENEKQVEHFLETHSEFVCLDMKTLVPSEVQDGFFMAKLQRKGV